MIERKLMLEKVDEAMFNSLGSISRVATISDVSEFETSYRGYRSGFKRTFIWNYNGLKLKTVISYLHVDVWESQDHCRGMSVFVEFPDIAMRSIKPVREFLYRSIMYKSSESEIGNLDKRINTPTFRERILTFLIDAERAVKEMEAKKARQDKSDEIRKANETILEDNFPKRIYTSPNSAMTIEANTDDAHKPLHADVYGSADLMKKIRQLVEDHANIDKQGRTLWIGFPEVRREDQSTWVGLSSNQHIVEVDKDWYDKSDDFLTGEATDGNMTVIVEDLTMDTDKDGNDRYLMLITEVCF